MLASLLPGLRDLRVPLATGFMWLIVGWLALYSFVPAREDATALVAELYGVLGFFGAAGVTAALTFVAYLIGILAVMLSNVASRVSSPPARVSDATSQQATVLVESVWSPYEREIARLEQSGKHRQTWVSSVQRRELPTFERLVDFEIELRSQIPLVATRLLADNRDLFDRYDRADAEAKFRLNIALPIVVIGVLIPIRAEAQWWVYPISIGVGLIVALLLRADGVRKSIDSNDAVWQAVFIGAVQFPAIEQLRAETVELARLNDEVDEKGGRAVAVGDGARGR